VRTAAQIHRASLEAIGWHCSLVERLPDGSQSFVAVNPGGHFTRRTIAVGSGRLVVTKL
jgi:hypothetical protein